MPSTGDATTDGRGERGDSRTGHDPGAVRRVLLVDDHPIVLEGLRELLRTIPGIDVVGAVTSANQAVDLAESRHPDLVILDLRLPEAFGPDVCRRLKRSSPTTKILIFTAFDDQALLRSCVDAGADGVVLKDQDDIVSAIERVLDGECVVDERLSLASESGNAFRALTSREREVLAFLAQGLTSKAIAGELHLAENTVRSYTQEILSKLGARNRVQAVTRAQELGLL